MSRGRVKQLKNLIREANKLIDLQNEENLKLKQSINKPVNLKEKVKEFFKKS